eukprot:TRINITY_DN5841_c0_g1_i4.p3 TRINITY_DN5841_c0_g1~~TRINITY_DN5841_c0_g1_i4.p3  ORF type:complete len:112 (-),score=41.13 TRINITY_DN5841_c0_g1_i4:292-627(-)
MCIRDRYQRRVREDGGRQMAANRIVPENIKEYIPKTIAAEDIPPDFMALLSLILSIAGLTIKSKYCTLGALLACVSSIGKYKSSEADLKQLVCTVTFAIMGTVMMYMAPNR